MPSLLQRENRPQQAAPASPIPDDEEEEGSSLGTGAIIGIIAAAMALLLCLTLAVLLVRRQREERLATAKTAAYDGDDDKGGKAALYYRDYRSEYTTESGTMSSAIDTPLAGRDTIATATMVTLPALAENGSSHPSHPSAVGASSDPPSAVSASHWPAVPVTTSQQLSGSGAAANGKGHASAERTDHSLPAGMSFLATSGSGATAGTATDTAAAVGVGTGGLEGSHSVLAGTDSAYRRTVQRQGLGEDLTGGDQTTSTGGRGSTVEVIDLATSQNESISAEQQPGTCPAQFGTLQARSTTDMSSRGKAGPGGRGSFNTDSQDSVHPLVHTAPAPLLSRDPSTGLAAPSGAAAAAEARQLLSDSSVREDFNAPQRPEISASGCVGTKLDDITLVRGVMPTEESYGGPRVEPLADVGPDTGGGEKVAAGTTQITPYVTSAATGVTAPLSKAPDPEVGMTDTDMFHASGAITNLSRQLDLFGKHDLFLGRFRMLGRLQRRRGGQAVVQFATGVPDGGQYAVKFFLDAESFYAEAALYAACFPSLRQWISDKASKSAALSPAVTVNAGVECESPDNLSSQMSAAMAKFLPQVEALRDGVKGELVDPKGRALPPCIVMEKGESLQEYSNRAEPDLFQSFAMLANIAQRMADMHAAGYAHRDLKPANVIWLPQKNRWTVIDFGCAACIGAIAPLSFTLAYAAPEVVRAFENEERDIESTEALDAWSLGVMAFELLTGAPAFRLLTDGRCRVMAQLRGDLPLPWEGELPQETQQKLGVLKGPVLQLLQRDPVRRVPMKRFADACMKLFMLRTTVQA